LKKCNKCSRTIGTSFFAVDKTTADGLSRVCRPCKQKLDAARTASRSFARSSPADMARKAESEAVAKRDLKKEHASLLAENTALRGMLSFKDGISKPVPTHSIKRREKTPGDAVAVALASDWHVEESVEPNTVHGLNEYNLEVAKTRADHYFRNALALTEMMARETKVETLLLALLGDFFTNFLHDENVQTNLLSPTPAAKYAQELLVSGIKFLLKESPYRLTVPCVAGNHGRMTKKMQVQNAMGTSLEAFMYHAIASRFSDEPRVDFRIAESKMMYVDLFESFKLRLIHGDDIKSGGGVGGITIPIRKKIAGWDKSIRADLTCMGHFHQFMDGGDFIVNGSLIGFNEYAQSIAASPEEARQAFFLVDARGGGQKSIVAPIWLDDKHKGRGAK
jgi:hypothetical protein